MHAVRIAVLLSLFLLPRTLAAQVRFQRHLINAQSEFSAATAFDVNGDGRKDIVSGAWWYEAPKWKKHRMRDVEMIRGRFDDYSNLALDVDSDGDLDIVSVNYRSQSLYWCENPGADSQGSSLWKNHVIDTPGPSETGRLVDIDGDGRLDVLPNGTKFAAWYRIEPSAEQVIWKRYELPEQLIGHGIGAGDLNGDGRIDLVCPTGWAEGPEDALTGRWLWHADFRLARDCGLPILCHDVDQDGDTDLIWGRGHNLGVYWTEQCAPEETSIHWQTDSDVDENLQARLQTTQWITHAIDTRAANLHTLNLADIDGDGHEDLVAGRRFYGHDGKDPGENDPLSICYYAFDSRARTWHAEQISFGGTCGIDTDSICIDLDDDGDIDILAPARSGLHYLENLRIHRKNTPDSNHPIAAQALDFDHREVNYFGHFAPDSVEARKMPMENALQHGIRRLQILAGMEVIMGALPNAEERVPLDIEVTSIDAAEGYTRVHLNYRSTSKHRVPAYLLIPDSLNEPAPAVLCLHPTNFPLGKAQICGMGGKPSRFYAHELAQRGFVCLAPDYPSFAEYECDFESDDFSSGSMRAIWDNLRAVDLLESLPCVKRDQIGAIGHSLGGHNALFTAAFDQRLRCVVTSCGFTAFEDYYAGNLTGWTSDRYMPAIAERFQSDPKLMPFDFHEVLAAIAPRPIFVSAPIHDSNFAVAGVRKCEAAVRPVFELLGRPDGLEMIYPDAEHDFPSEIRNRVYDWLNEKLQ